MVILCHVVDISGKVNWYIKWSTFKLLIVIFIGNEDYLTLAILIDTSNKMIFLTREHGRLSDTWVKLLQRNMENFAQIFMVESTSDSCNEKGWVTKGEK